MPRFEIEQYQTHVARCFVDAPTAAEAIQLLYADDIPAQHIKLTFLEINEDVGMPEDQDPDLAQALRALGSTPGGSFGVVVDNEGFIPSIASITEIDQTPSAE